MGEVLGEATLKLKADTSELDAALSAAEERVRESVARIQETLAGLSAARVTADAVPGNKWCIIRGTPGTDPLTIVGPFDTSELATLYEAQDAAEASVPSVVDVLVAPANC